MGRIGSDRWLAFAKKQLVEESLTFDVAHVIRSGLLTGPPRAHRELIMTWKNPATGEAIASASGILTNTGGAWLITLKYRLTSTGEDFSIPVPLQTTRLGSRRTRYWGTCPDCGRRVMKLHLLPHGKRFSCRKCLDLSYTSAQTAHAMDCLNRFIARFGERV